MTNKTKTDGWGYLLSPSHKEKAPKYQEKLTPYWRDKPSHAWTGKPEWNKGKRRGQNMGFYVS